MCGIAGIICSRRPSVPEAWLAALQRSLQHRGPDDAGTLEWTAPLDAGRGGGVAPVSVALAHRRLSVIDLTANAHQPMSGPLTGPGKGRYHLVYNGMIYNYQELRPELAALGWRFCSSSDTEVLLAAWSCWGTRCLERLVGMFAFGILDTAERTLWLVRDFFGIKPLYYVHMPDGLAFASEPAALLELPGVGRRADPQRVLQYLRFGLTDDGQRTFFADVRQVPAASWMRFDIGELDACQTKCYWRPEAASATDLGFADAAAELRRLVLDNVRLHLRSDVPLGTALSGGIDSSAIAAAARVVRGESCELHAVSYMADAPAICEKRWVDHIAASTRATVHPSRVSGDELAAQLDTLIRVQGEPFGGTSIFAQYCLYRTAHEAGLKVLFSGQGSDEFFGGYDNYRAARFASLLKQGRLGAAARFLRHLSRGHPARALALAASYVLPDRLHGVPRRLAGKSLRPAWLRKDWLISRGAALEPLFHPRSSSVLHEQLLQALTQTSLPLLLRVEDRNSMCFGIESRVPFLTPAMAHFARSLPEDYLIGPDGVGKRILRAAMRGLVPDAILVRRDKIGFATPEDCWLRELVTSRGAAACEAAGAVLDGDHVRRQFRMIQEGTLRPRAEHWRWLNLARWMELLGVAC